VSETVGPWYQTVQQRHYTKAYPSTQALFVELREARRYSRQLMSLVQQYTRLVTTFTRHHKGDAADRNRISDYRGRWALA
jgi:hypothetical protein